MNLISAYLNDFKCPLKEPVKGLVYIIIIILFWVQKSGLRVVCKNSLCPVHSWNWQYLGQNADNNNVFLREAREAQQCLWSQACLNPDPSSTTSWLDELT